MEIGLMVAPQQGASYEDILQVATLAERLGFSSFMRSEHYMAFAGPGLPGPTDAWVTLGALARETTRIELGTLVSSATFRLPGPLAIAVAQVDVMSGGRVRFGLGAGWAQGEHLAYGIPFPPPRERFDRLDEQLSIIRGLWTTPLGTTFNFDGRYFQLRSSPGLPKPMRQPHPPIIVGGSGLNRTPSLAARHADEYNYSGPLPPIADLERAFERVNKACESQGRDPRTLLRSLVVTVVCGTDRRELQQRLDAPDGSFFDVAGLPEEVIVRLHAYRAIGAQRLYLRVNHLQDIEHVELLGRRVVPALASA